MSTSLPSQVIPESYNGVIWKDNGPLAELSVWAPQRKITKWLMEIAEVQAISDTFYAENIPSEFKVGSLAISFLPHWGFCKLGPLQFSLPESKEQLLHDIELCQKRLRSRSGHELEDAIGNL